MTKRTYTRIEPIKGATAKTTYFTLSYTILWLCFLFGIAQSIYTNDYRWFVMTGGAMAGAYMLTNRKDFHDELQYLERELYDAKPQTIPPHKPPTQEAQIATHVVRVDAPNQKSISIGKYRLTRTEGMRLEQELRGNDWRFTRDCAKDANIASFKRDINRGQWGQIVGEFERLGFVEGGKLTDSGRSWLAQFSTPLTYRNGH